MPENMRRLTIRAGVQMFPRDMGESPERANHDRDVLALPTSSTRGGGGHADAWSFVWTRRGKKTFWYVLDRDVSDPEDFPDEPGYRR